MLYAPGWRDQNASRAFPFEFAASRSSGTLTLPDTWLIDAALYPTSGRPPYCIQEIVVREHLAEIFISDADSVSLGKGLAARTSTDPVAIYSLSDDSQPIATLVPSKEANHALFEMGDGNFVFGPSSASFVLSTVAHFSLASGLSSFKVFNEMYQSSEIVLVAEQGVQYAVGDSTEPGARGESRDVIRANVHAVGDPQFLTRNCDDLSRRPIRFVRELVFQYGDVTHICAPDEFGNILFLAQSPGNEESALHVTQSSNAVIIRLSGERL